jgi:spermidine/putrescine transport system permease protein
MKALKKIYLAIILFFLYSPIAVLVVFSFNQSKSRAHFTGFTLKWYALLFSDKAILKALYTTLAIASISALTATFIGTFAAIGINKMNKLYKQMSLSLNNLPVINPDIVTGVSLMIFFLSIFKLLELLGVAWKLGFTTLLLANIMFNIPYVILAILPRLSSLNENIYEAALDLGANPNQAFIKVIFPEIMPSIITGGLLAFTLSIDDFVISYFTAGSGVSTLSMNIYTMTKRGINPTINALSTIMFLVVMVLLFLINKIDSGKQGKGDGILNEG